MSIQEVEEEMKKLELLAQKQPKDIGLILGDTYVGFMSLFARDLGWERVNKLVKNLVKTSGAANFADLKKLNPSIGNGPLEAFYAYVYSAFKMDIGWKIKVVECKDKKIRMNCSGTCIIYSAAKKYGLEKEVDSCGICFASHSNIIKAVNPNLNYSVLSSMCKGNDFCDFVIEL